MLSLTRKVGQRVFVGDVPIEIVSVRGDKVRLSFDAPRDVPIHREEVRRRIEAGEPLVLA